MIEFLLVGLIAGSLAKMITPQKEKSGWLSSLLVGIAGSFVGGFLAGILNITTHGFIGELVFASVGAVLVLFIYHKYFGHKNLL